MFREEAAVKVCDATLPSVARKTWILCVFDFEIIFVIVHSETIL